MRERAQYLESLQAQTLETFQWKETRAMLAPEHIAAFTRIINGLYIPNIKDGLATKPKKIPSDYPTPTIPLRESELVVAEPRFRVMNSFQEHAVQRALAGWSGNTLSETEKAQFVDKINAEMLGIPLPLTITATHNSPASVNSLCASVPIDPTQFPHIGKTAHRLFRGQPILQLTQSKEVHPQDPPILIHEAQHVIQGNSQPILNASRKKAQEQFYRNELEAYYIGFTYGAALYGSADPRFADNADVLNGASVELLRREHQNPADPFFPTKALIQALEGRGLDSIVTKA